MRLAPVILFVFNRPQHTQRTIGSLTQNPLAVDSELFVFSDGPRTEADRANVDAVRSIVGGIQGFKRVIVREREVNQGLAGSVIEGVSEVIQPHGNVIVVEDDLEFSPHFLRYMNEALNRYRDDRKIFSIGGYSPPIQVPAQYRADSYLSYRCCTWGWATWRDRWEKVDWDVRDFDRFAQDKDLIARFNRGGDDMLQILKLQMDGKISSWGIRWDYAHFKNDAYCFRPVRAIVGSIGNDGTGVHCGATDKFDVRINCQPILAFPEPGSLKLDEELNRRFATFYDGRPRLNDGPGAGDSGTRSFLRRLIARGIGRAGR